MALNTLKCNHLTPLCFKGLTQAQIYPTDLSMTYRLLGSL